ncbi:MAG: hypothetical protein LAN62_06885 [Acidobacteriia bacterium]|nr:hypothetical protein [Terriglobia bacterium]
MKATAALKEGFGMARRGRPAIWALFLVNLGVAAVAALPIYRGILQFTGHSLMSRQLASGLPVDWFIDFSRNSPGSLDRYAALIAVLGILSIPLNAVLAGGVLGHLRQGGAPFSLAVFFQDTGRYGWRLIRLMFIGLVGYWIVFCAFKKGLDSHIMDASYDWQSDRTVFALRLAINLVMILGLCLVNLVMDYARVRLVLEDGTSAVEAFLASCGFAYRRFRKATMVYALPALAGAALLGLYWLLIPWALINSPGEVGAMGNFRAPLTVALLFLIQQAVMFGRYWFRVAGWASEWAYYSTSQ